MADQYLSDLPEASDITDTKVYGEQSDVAKQFDAQLFKGDKGDKGDTGDTGATGPQGATGSAGADGADGQGVPTGGTPEQILSKINGTDYNTQWVDKPGTGGFSANTDGTPCNITAIRADGTACALSAGASGSNFRFDSAGNFQIQSQPKSDIVAGNGDNMATLMTLTNGGDLTVTGTVEGRNMTTDGSKLDNIEPNATADQTGAEMVTAINTELGSTDWQSSGGTVISVGTTAPSSPSTGDLWVDTN
jgi:hypothetical protein